MNIRPLYDRIVVKRIEEEESTHNGIIIPDSAKEKPQEGEVMAVGRGKRLENGGLADVEVKVGDRILLAKYSGSETKLDGTEIHHRVRGRGSGCSDRQRLTCRDNSSNGKTDCL